MADRLDYFARKDTDEIGDDLRGQIDRYYRDVETTGYFQLLKKLYGYYFGTSGDSSDQSRMYRSHTITRGGVAGESHDFKVNEFRNLLQHVLVMTTAERPAFQCMITNTDSRSQKQQELGSGLLEYYMTEKRLERHLVRAAEYAVSLCQGYVVLGWDTSAGRQIDADPETGEPINEGDLTCVAKHGFDVIGDPHATDGKHTWRIVRRRVNRFDLAAEYPDKQDEILNTDRVTEAIEKFSFDRVSAMKETDQISVFDFYHARTPAVPDGRMTTFLAGGDVLFDGPLPFQEVPVYEIKPASIFDTPYGYSSAIDVLAIQEGIDRLNSAVLTNQSTFARQHIWAPRGSGLSPRDVSEGLTFIEGEPGMEPKPLQLTATAPEVFKYLETLSFKAEQLVGINSIVRGQPAGQLSGASGAAMALLASQAIQFSSGLQREYEFLCEDVGTGIIQILQQYATTERVALISGIDKSSYLETFTASSIDRINRVVVKRVSALAKTTSGKLDIAKTLMDAGMIKNPEQYISVLRTGSLEPIMESERSELLNIKQENEMLRKGEVPHALATDDLSLHLREHKTVLDDPNMRRDPEVIEAVREHMRMHMEVAQNADPRILGVLGIPAVPPDPRMAMAMAQPQAQPAAPSGPEQVTQSAEAVMAGSQPSGPSMPTNPLTGDRFEPAVPGAANVSVNQ